MDAGNSSSSIISDLRAQWSNPVDISTILLVIGGDVVQRAFARGTGKAYTPVCFSFGCVAYAFIALMNVIGDGRLLPPADYPARVFNLSSGSVRDGKSWVVGRLLRDLETDMARREPCDDDGIRISVFEAAWVRLRRGHSWRRRWRRQLLLQRGGGKLRGMVGAGGGGTMLSGDLTTFPWSRTHLYGLFFTLVQMGIAVGAWWISGDWSTFMITASGTVLVQLMGILPQWTAEKLPGRQTSSSVFALTSGNGAKDIVVIIGFGNLLDLEELATPPSPRSSRPWEKFSWLSTPRRQQQKASGPDKEGAGGDQQQQQQQQQEKQLLPSLPEKVFRRAYHFRGIPLGHWLTRIVCVSLSVVWLLLLINVGAPKEHSWFLLVIGAIGMFQNAYIAAAERDPRASNVPLEHVDTVSARKVMDGLMDFHDTYGLAEPLLREYFPGRLRPDEEAWWRGGGDEGRRAYDEARERDPARRRTSEQKAKPKFRLSTSTFLRAGAGGGPLRGEEPVTEMDPVVRPPEPTLP